MSVPRSMKAAVLHGWNDVRLEEVPVPTPGPGEVLCRVRACAICSTDHRLIGGRAARTFKGTFPHIPGHEWAGEVVAVTDGAEGFAAGDRVVGQVTKGCGRCPACKRGSYQLCVHSGQLEKGYRMHGFNLPGAFAGYVAYLPEMLTRLPDHVSFEEGALASVYSQALHGVELGACRAGETAAVIGPGAIGLLVLQTVKLRGAARVFVTGRGPRLGMARELGADAAVDIAREDPVAALRELTDGQGAEVVFECAGKPEAIDAAVRAAKKGGRVVLIGVTGRREGIPVDTDHLVLNQISLLGMRGSPNLMAGAV
ncbi:MAG: zinc-binding dehydrogenase, partial [Nitrospinota bacterium]